LTISSPLRISPRLALQPEGPTDPAPPCTKSAAPWMSLLPQCITINGTDRRWIGGRRRVGGLTRAGPHPLVTTTLPSRFRPCLVGSHAAGMLKPIVSGAYASST
jgi:hypothetical protein